VLDYTVTDFKAQRGLSSEALDRAAFTTGSVGGRRGSDEYSSYDFAAITRCGIAWQG
jgi:hypothetical protein